MGKWMDIDVHPSGNPASSTNDGVDDKCNDGVDEDKQQAICIHLAILVSWRPGPD
jgi:hypothetical protein